MRIRVTATAAASTSTCIPIAAIRTMAATGTVHRAITTATTATTAAMTTAVIRTTAATATAATTLRTIPAARKTVIPRAATTPAIRTDLRGGSMEARPILAGPFCLRAIRFDNRSWQPVTRPGTPPVDPRAHRSSYPREHRIARSRPVIPTITAFERSPDRGQGLARDMRVRWALEEVGQPYNVRLLSFKAMKESAHLALHPFGQIPTYEEDDLALFETGAIVFHIAEHRAGLLPGDVDARARAI